MWLFFMEVILAVHILQELPNKHNIKQNKTFFIEGKSDLFRE